MSLLKQDTIKKEQVDKTIELELEKSNNKEYKVVTICNSTVYVSKSESHLQG